MVVVHPLEVVSHDTDYGFVDRPKISFSRQVRPPARIILCNVSAAH